MNNSNYSTIKKRTNKVLAIVLTIAMVLSMFPSMAFATDDNLNLSIAIDGTSVNMEKMNLPEECGTIPVYRVVLPEGIPLNTEITLTLGESMKLEQYCFRSRNGYLKGRFVGKSKNYIASQEYVDTLVGNLLPRQLKHKDRYTNKICTTLNDGKKYTLPLDSFEMPEKYNGDHYADILDTELQYSEVLIFKQELKENHREECARILFQFGGTGTGGNTINKTGLEAAITSASAISGSAIKYYTENDRYDGKDTSKNGFWAEFQSTLADAKKTNDSQYASQNQVDKAIETLNAAFAKLIPNSRVNATNLYEKLQCKWVYYVGVILKTDHTSNCPDVTEENTTDAS